MHILCQIHLLFNLSWLISCHFPCLLLFSLSVHRCREEKQLNMRAKTKVGTENEETAQYKTEHFHQN